MGQRFHDGAEIYRSTTKNWILNAKAQDLSISKCFLHGSGST